LPDLPLFLGKSLLSPDPCIIAPSANSNVNGACINKAPEMKVPSGTKTLQSKAEEVCPQSFIAP